MDSWIQGWIGAVYGMLVVCSKMLLIRKHFCPSFDTDIVLAYIVVVVGTLLVILLITSKPMMIMMMMMMGCILNNATAFRSSYSTIVFGKGKNFLHLFEFSKLVVFTWWNVRAFQSTILLPSLMTDCLVCLVCTNRFFSVNLLSSATHQ